MHKFISLIGMFVFVGCASTSSTMPASAPKTAPEAAAAPAAPAAPAAAPAPCEGQDGFDAAGKVAADGSRWMYVKVREGWGWVNTEEHKAELKKFIDELKLKIDDPKEKK